MNDETKKHTMASNRERQKDEIEAIESICDTEEFYKLSDQDYELGLDVAPSIKKGILEVGYLLYLKNYSRPIRQYFRVKNLPPCCLRIHLPQGYPGFEPPTYQLHVSWLAPWECAKLCQRLDELWLENHGSEILFLWRNFLRYELFDCLGYHETLDVTFLFSLYREPHNMRELLELGDSRGKIQAKFIHPMVYLRGYDESQRKIVFSKEFHTCGICFDDFSGENSIAFAGCEHVYCKLCLARYFSMKIKNGESNRILCPFTDCRRSASYNHVKELCPQLFDKYQEDLFACGLRVMDDVVFCARTSCQKPVIVERGENLATCSVCKYSFCSYCRKVYHGVAPCAMTSEATMELIEKYLRGSLKEKEELTKKYGRVQIQTLVEAGLSKDYIKKYTKSCPKCKTSIEKSYGCNRILCTNCNTDFCWLCGLTIDSANRYEHFTNIDKENPCFARLFEGIEEIDDEFLAANTE